MQAPHLRFRLGILLAALACGAIPAAGAPDPESTTVFAEHSLLADLGERGLGTLIERWAADPPGLGDPATPRVLEAAQAHAEEVAADRMARAAVDAAGLQAAAEAAEAALERRLAALRSLARDPALATHPQRAIFAADLAETLLVGRLERRLRHADLFAIFGRPVAEVETVAATLAEALGAAQEAARAAQTLRSGFARDADAEAAAQASGLAAAVLELVAERRAPLYAASAALGLASLPAEAIESVEVALAGRLDDPAQERRRLLQLAERSARELLDAAPGPLAPAGRLLLARTEAAGGDPAAAVSTLRDLAPELPGGRLGVTNQLTLARAAAEDFTEAAALAATSGDPMLSLLVADAASRRAEAAGDTAAAAAAYAGLPAALDGLVRARRASLASGSGGTDADPRTLPPLVAAAVAREALAAGDAERAREAAAAAVEGLGDPASLPAGPERSAAIGAAADLASATAAAAPGDPAATDAAVAGLLAVARGFPRSPEAEPAMARAADLAAAAQAATGLPDGPVADRYAEAMVLLYDRFPDTAAAARHRLYWAHAGHALRGDDAAAAEVYESVPLRDPGRLDALALALSARERAAAAAGSAEAAGSLLDAAEGTAGRLVEEARTRADEDPAAAVLGVGRAALALARIELARENPSSAAAGLEALEDRLGAISSAAAAREAARGLAAEGAGLRVAAFLAAGEPDRAAAEAAAMMREHPAAAPGVVKSVLADLLGRADALREQAGGASASRARELEETAAEVSASAVSLARLLLADAEARGLAGADLLPWRLAYANGLTGSGDPAAAIGYLAETDVLENFPADAAALEAAADARYALAIDRTADASGGSYRLTDAPRADAAAREAAPLYDRLIRGLSSTKPPAFWRAWARRLAINLALGEGVDRVALSVSQLEDQDPALGGPATAARLREVRAAASR